MQRNLRLAALPLLVVWAAVAQAAPRITVAPITGDKRAQVQSQISAALCKQNTCVASTRVFTKKKPDWKKIQSANVQGLLVGGIAKAKTGTGKELQLSWLNRPGKAAQSWTFPLTKQGKLTTSSLQSLSGDVNNLSAGAPVIAPGGDSSVAAGVAAGAAAVAAGGAAVAAGQMTPAVPPEPLPLPVSPTPPPATGTLADTPVAKDAGADQGYESPRHQWRFAVEAGDDLINRDLSYQNSTGLRPYSVGLMPFVPHFRLEFYPIAFFSDGLFAGIGLFGDYAFSIGFKSNSAAGDEGKGTSYSRWQAGLEWRLRFWRDSDFAIVPFFSYTNQKFTTQGDPPTIGFNGLPQFDLSGYRMGLRFDIPIASWFWIIVSGDYVLWTTKHVDVQAADGTVGATLTGSGHAIEAELGFAFTVAGPFQIRVFGTYSSTSFSFDPGQPNSADSATDRYIGGRVMLRLQF